MKTWMCAVSLVVSFAVSVAVAMQLARFLEMDSCIDAGGTYMETTGACDIDGLNYVALFSRPNHYVFWTLFLGACFISGWVVFRIMIPASTKLPAAQQRRAGDVAKPRA